MRRSGLAGRAQALGIVLATVGLLLVTFRLNLLLTPDGAATATRVVPSLGLATGIVVAWPSRRAEVLVAVLVTPLVGAVLRGSLDGATVGFVLTIGTIGLIQAALVDVLLAGLLGRPIEIRRPTHAMFHLGVALASAAIAATLLTLALLVLPEPAEPPVDVSWTTWVPRFFAELALCVPAALALRTPSLRLTRRAGQVEATVAAIALLAALVLATVEAFAATYFAAPIVVWLAIRFGPKLAAPALLVAITGLGVIAAYDPTSFQAASSPDRLAALTMAFAAAGVVLISLAQQATDDRFNLLTTLSALPDTVALTAPGGRVVEVWGPRDDPLPRRVLRELIETAEALAGNGVEHHSHQDRLLEHTWQTAHNGQRLHVIRDVTTEMALAEERRRRREEVQLATLAEQRRIAVRLHAGPVQQLSAILLRQGGLLDADDPVREIALVEDQLTEVIAELRGAANELIPPDVGAGSVAEALRELAPRVFEPHVVCVVDDQRWSHHSVVESETLYLVGNEALVNAAVHAHPSEVRVALVGLPGRALLSVADDGPGLLPPSEGRRHLGLRLLKERLTALGGTLELSTSESGGLLLVASIPRDEPGPTSTRSQGRGASSTFAS